MTHILATFTFAFSCFGLWALLNVLGTVSGRSQPLPAFTTLIVGLRWWLLLLPIPVVVYCVYSLFRPAETARNGTAFLAGTTSALSLILFPVLLALFLPCVLIMDQLWK